MARVHYKSVTSGTPSLGWLDSDFQFLCFLCKELVFLVASLGILNQLCPGKQPVWLGGAFPPSTCPPGCGSVPPRCGGVPVTASSQASGSVERHSLQRGDAFEVEVCDPKSFPGGSVGENLPASVVAVGSIPGSGRSPGREYDNPLQCSCLGNRMHRGAWWVAVHGVTKCRTQLRD